MARESWIAVQADIRRDLTELFRHYGFSPLDQREVPNDPAPWSVEWREEAPDGTLGFYAFYSEPWTLIYDPWLMLWEEVSVHSWASQRFSALVLAGVFKSSADAFGYGEFEHGGMHRWIFRQGDHATQNIGTPAPWESTVLRGVVGDIAPGIRRHWGIHPEQATEVVCVFAALPGIRPRRTGWFPWLPWRRRPERRIGTQTY